MCVYTVAVGLGGDDTVAAGEARVAVFERWHLVLLHDGHLFHLVWLVWLVWFRSV